MSIQAVLAPLFVQVALTFVLLVWMGHVRAKALRARQVHIRDIALRQPNWPVPVAQVSNAYHNQLELPILFYVLTILVIVTKKADLTFVVMAWLFVALRIVQAAIHTTTNRVPRRGLAFAIGAVVLIVMWVIFAVRILFNIG